MTTGDVFDERLQFFLRNREVIKEWAAIESDVMAALREILQRSQPLIEERLLGLDPNAVVGRHDSSPWERILARHDDWPPTVGLALEWHRSGDLLGGARPKIGVFWWADPTTLIAPRTRFVEAVARQPLHDLGYKVPLEAVWPVGTRVEATADWWQDPDAWIAAVIDRLAGAWALVEPAIEEVLVGVERQVSRG